jgi:methionyl-tRNA formyltransferase
MMRLLFMGTPAFALPSLRGLLASDHQLLAVVTQPDRPRGRGRAPAPSPVKQVAQDAGLLVLQPARIGHILQRIRELGPECLVVAAYGQILPPQLLRLPEHGCINVHASLLPKYRGAAPINWAIINGEDQTGVSIMLMDEGVDSGAILAQAAIPIEPQDTAGSLHDKLARLGGELLLATLTQVEEGRLAPRPQDEQKASYAPRLCKQDGLIDWHQAAEVIERRVRGLNPWPGAYSYLEGKRIKLVEAQASRLPSDEPARPGQIIGTHPHRGITIATGEGILVLKRLQPESRPVMGAAQYLVGQRQSLVGRIFSSPL